MKKEELRDLIKEFESTTLTKITIEEKDFKVSLEKNMGNVHYPNQIPMQNSGIESPVLEMPKAMKSIDAPLVGTFYLTRSPGGKPLVSPGQKIQVGEVVCIIEAMKVMNEIQADKEGIVKAILAPSGKLVEYNQPLLEIE